MFPLPRKQWGRQGRPPRAVCAARVTRCLCVIGLFAITHRSPRYISRRRCREAHGPGHCGEGGHSRADGGTAHQKSIRRQWRGPIMKRSSLSATPAPFAGACLVLQARYERSPGRVVIRRLACGGIFTRRRLARRWHWLGGSSPRNDEDSCTLRPGTRSLARGGWWGAISAKSAGRVKTAAGSRRSGRRARTTAAQRRRRRGITPRMAATGGRREDRWLR